jgi:5-hydroxyisourate hydrolase
MSRTLIALTVAAAIAVIGCVGAFDPRRAGAADNPAVALSTHVLDAVNGRPAPGLQVRLERGGDLLGQGKTDGDGRLELGPPRLEPGTYRLTFDIDGYDPNSFFPEITVTFRLREPRSHLHVPILLSSFAYTTYRGS